MTGCSGLPINRYKICDNLTWKNLDGQQLKFRSDFRPAARYLYFHYLMAMLKAEKNASGTACQKIAWATPGKYIQQNVLAALVREVGDVDPSEAKVFEEHAIPGSETLSGEDVSDLSRELLAGACLEKMEEEDWEEDD